MKETQSHSVSTGKPRDRGSGPRPSDPSLKRKLASQTLLVAAISVLIVCVVFFVYEMILFPDGDSVRAVLVVAGTALISLFLAAVLAHRFLQNQAIEVERSHREFERSILEETESTREIRDAALDESRLKSEILSNVSHEIRTPMTGVMGMIDLVLDSDLTEKQKDLLETAKTSSEAVIAVIGDLLDFTAMETGRMHFEIIDFDLRHHLSRIESALDFQAIQKELHFVYRVDDAVPFLLTGDPVRLQQIIFNLVGNAIKFSDHGQIVLNVARESQTANRVLLHFTVADKGIGIPKEKQTQIFEAFTQVTDSGRRRYEGIGLGLAISCRLVEQMGGKIWVESEEGEGSVFHFTVDMALQNQPQGVLGTES